MLHEILLALLGYTGDLIIDERDHQLSLDVVGPLHPDATVSPDCTFKLAPDLSSIQPSDRVVIEKIVALGFYYRELDRFSTKSRNLSWIRSSNWHPLSRSKEMAAGKKEEEGRQSLYRRAIANGIVEILSVYRSAVLLVEQNLLADSVHVLAKITHGLHKFFVILPPLYELVVEIEREDIRGGQLLNLLHLRCQCGVPELQTCIKRLLWHGHQVMYNQLASWMVYGILLDPHGEFFIERQEDGGVKAESCNMDMPGKFLSADVASMIDWQTGFHISLDMLPEYINMHVAESILFAGKAVSVLRNPRLGFQSQDTVPQQQMPKLSQRVQGSLLPDVELEDTLFPQAESDKIEAMLRDLKESSEFHRGTFACTMDSIRTIAARHLWQLIVVRADLIGHLKALKDYFLLAKGDFFQCFLEESRNLMRLPPRQSTAEADLMVPFQLAAVKTISDEDKYFSRVSLRIHATGVVEGKSSSLPSNASSETSLDGWDGITLEYSIDWPLQLFFTQEVLSKYCRVFEYLLRLKRTQMELEKSWASMMHQDHSDHSKQRAEGIRGFASQHWWQHIRPMWRVREHMAFLIRNLQFYIQVDVIESQWNALQGHIEDSHDFSELVNFHQDYLSALVSQSFLDIGSVSRILDSIMKLCLRFCWTIESQECSNAAELNHITEEFNKKSNSLYTILRSSRLAGSQRAPFLRRFLLRLNFNSFFEATAKGVVMNASRP